MCFRGGQKQEKKKEKGSLLYLSKKKMTSTTVDLLPLPQAIIPIQTQLSDLNFTNDDFDPEIIQQEQDKLFAEQVEKNRELCKTQPWWTCNTQKTQGACHLNSNSMCVPVGLKSQAKSYFEQWIQVYGPFYRAMETQTPRQRSLSIEKQPTTTKIHLTQPTLPFLPLNSTKYYKPNKR